MTTHNKLGTVFLLVIVGLQVLCACPVLAGGLCQQYGHSCLGGHGKRSSSSSSQQSPSWINLLEQLQKSLGDGRPPPALPYYKTLRPSFQFPDFWRMPSGRGLVQQPQQPRPHGSSYIEVERGRK